MARRRPRSKATLDVPLLSSRRRPTLVTQMRCSALGTCAENREAPKPPRSGISG